MDLKIEIREHIETLERLGTRYCTTDGCRRALDYIETRIREYGYTVERSVAQWEGLSFPSPWAIKTGRGPALYLLTAHYDSISQSKDGKLLDQAPGADDNATGVAILLETAKALVHQNLNCSVGFVFFNVEEVGQHGSKEFAKEWKEAGRRIDGVINIDTIGTWPVSLQNGGQVNYVSNPTSQPLLDRIKASFNLPLKPATTPWEDDHASFWAEGFQAIELTEEGCTPVMHTPADTSEKVDVQSVARVATALIKMFSNDKFSLGY